MKILSKILAATALVSLTAASQAHAGEGVYVSVSGALTLPSDSDNDGEFSSAFTTGQGSEAIPEATALPAGTPVGWTTEFDAGYALNAAIGNDLGAFRLELEGSLEKSKIDTHVNVSAAGLDLTVQDAAVLISGQATGLGVSVGDLVADGDGSLKTASIFINAYYDIETDSPLTPYVGAGIGYGWTDVDYRPSETQIIDDDDGGFTYQAMVGAAYAVSDRSSVFVGARYRASDDATVDAELFPATFDVENKRTMFEVGFRTGF